MAAPAWHRDPFHRHELRWFDGNTWTAQVSDRGVTSVDPRGTTPTQTQAPMSQPTPPEFSASPPPTPYPAPARKKSRSGLVAVIIGVIVLAAAGGAVVLLGGDDDGDRLSDEIAGVRALLDGADPDIDAFQLLGDDCVVDVIEILTSAGVNVPSRAEAEDAAAYAAAGFDKPFYDCYVAVDSVGYALDAVEIGSGVNVTDLEDLLDGIADDVGLLRGKVEDGSVIEACTDTEVIGTFGAREEDAFCEYYWTFDGAGLAIIAAAHASLEMNGPDVLKVAVPEVLEALAKAAE